MSAPSDDLDAATVTALLAAHVEAGLRCTSVVRGAVGNGQETWFIDAHDDRGARRQFVLRRSARAGVLDDTDRGHEYATLRTLEGRGLPTPRVHWIEGEQSSLGRPYFVMDRMPGRPPSPKTADEAALLARDLGRWIARLHTTPTHVPAGVDVRTTTHREVMRWKERYLSRRASPVPMIGALLAWLEVNLPTPGVPPVLLWGDPGPHNVLVKDGQISALLDWELSHVGHPLEDLGAAVWACLGRYPEDEVITGYEDVTGRGVDRDLLAYFAVLGCVSRTVMQFAGTDAFIRGDTSALNLAGLGLTLPTANLRRAAAYAGWPEVEPEPIGEPTDEDDMRMRPDLGETLDGVGRFLADQVLPQIEEPYLRRGLKTATALIRAAAQRGREESVRSARSRLRRDALFDRLEATGVVVPGSPRDAHALESIAVRVESDPALRDSRCDVRATLLADLVDRAGSLEQLAQLYGPDVQPGQPFRR